MKIEYAVQVIWSPEDNAYIAMAAELPGAMADGATPEEALANVRVVIQEWIDTAKEEGHDIPKPLTTDDFARLQQESQAALQKQIEQQVRQAATQAAQEVIAKLSVLLQRPPSNAWAGSAVVYTEGEFEPSETLVLAGGGHHKHRR